MKNIPLLLAFLFVGVASAGAQAPAAARASLPVRIFATIGHELKETVLDVVLFRDPAWSSMVVYQYSGFAADTYTTAGIFHVCPRCFEGGPLAHGTHSAFAVGSAWFGVNFAGTLLSSELHRHSKSTRLDPNTGSLLYGASAAAPTYLGTNHWIQAGENIKFYHALTPAEKAP